MIELQGLTRTFGEKVAVDGVSFAVERGELFGFIGPNGSGKTTTVRMLCTILKPTSGDALVVGFSVLRDAHRVRASLGVLFQEPSLDVRLTAYENMYFYSQLYWPGAGAVERRARIRELVELVELGGEADHFVHTFSWGMKRRLEIARALIPEPPVLILDEPTTGLDLHTKVNIWKYLKLLNAERGLTVFLTTHDMDEAELCRRVAVIDHGRIVALDTPGHLGREHGGGEGLRAAFLALTGEGLRDEKASLKDQVRHRGDDRGGR